LNRAAADVNPFLISRQKFEPAHAGCHGILGWTIGGSARAARAVSSAPAGNIGDVFDGASNTTAGAAVLPIPNSAGATCRAGSAHEALRRRKSDVFVQFSNFVWIDATNLETPYLDV
jgi:hypothetical protein